MCALSTDPRPYDLTDGARDFEERYRTQQEPWRFGERAAELLRHDWILGAVRELAPHRLLDIGCSLGQLTRRLATLPSELYAVDISPTAVARARALLRANGAVRFAVASSMRLPFPSRFFDVVLACDGLYSWELDVEERQKAIAEIRGVLAKTGRALFTEHTRPERFDRFIGAIAAGGFRIVSVSYLYDRPWYQFESWFRGVRDSDVKKRLLRSVPIARALQAVGRVVGRTASRHVCVLAERE
jgi:SAM-dependent methyltransferase